MRARMNATLEVPLAMPLDIKLMNIMSSFMVAAVVLLLAAALLWWLVRLPLFALRFTSSSSSSIGSKNSACLRWSAWLKSCWP